jgi:C1A family cysteine protease
MGNWFSGHFEESFPITIRDTHVYGWKPDLPDIRDMVYCPPEITIPNNIDLRDTKNIPTESYTLSLCTTNTLCTVFEYEQKRQLQQIFKPSQLFLYYNERVLDQTTDCEIGGGSIRDGLKIINKIGICSESKWASSNSCTTKPDISAFVDAQEHKSIKYSRVKQTLVDIKSALVLQHPIIFGFSVYESFDDTGSEMKRENTMKIPKPNEKMLGGRVALVCGYDDETKLFLVRDNTDWVGDYFWMSYDFLLSGSCSDFWIMEKVMKTTETKTLADIVRGYQIRENEMSDSDSDSECEIMDDSEAKVEGDVMKKSKSIVDLTESNSQ